MSRSGGTRQKCKIGYFNGQRKLGLRIVSHGSRSSSHHFFTLALLSQVHNSPASGGGGGLSSGQNLRHNTNKEAPAMQRNGRVNSGDVSIFYRAFGARGRTPILLMHGANYFDSYDWIGVGEALASDREVASFDKRGFGESGWSPSKDYSVDANMGDILAVMAELKWERPIVVGHSASRRLAISFAANFPHKISRLVVVDSALGREEGGGAAPKTSNPPLVFDTVEAGMAQFAKLS